MSAVIVVGIAILYLVGVAAGIFLGVRHESSRDGWRINDLGLYENHACEVVGLGRRGIILVHFIDAPRGYNTTDVYLMYTENVEKTGG